MPVLQNRIGYIKYTISVWFSLYWDVLSLFDAVNNVDCKCVDWSDTCLSFTGSGNSSCQPYYHSGSEKSWGFQNICLTGCGQAQQGGGSFHIWHLFHKERIWFHMCCPVFLILYRLWLQHQLTYRTIRTTLLLLHGCLWSCCACYSATLHQVWCSTIICFHE